MTMIRRPSRRLTWLLVTIALLGLGAGVLLPYLMGAPRPTPGVRANRALEAVRRQRWASADASLDRLAALHPSTAEEAILRAEVRRGQGRVDEALAVLAAIPDSDPLAARARLIAGQLHRGRDRLRDAEADFMAALRL